MEKYTLGLDFGTLSARALLVRVSDGYEMASVAMDYPHGVMDSALPDGTPLGTDWALEHPQDFLDALYTVVPQTVQKAGVSPEDIIGIGVDFTTCTVLPVKRDGTPLCFLPEFAGEPHAYVKLWKHHAAQKQATRMEQEALRRNEKFMERYGGKISSEAAFPKLLSVCEEAPAVYAATDYFLEAGDWIVWKLTGKQVRNAAMAGFKAFWSPSDGYPKAFLEALHPNFAGVLDKMDAPIVPSGAAAGVLTEEAAEKLGLCAGTVVTAAHLDAHVTLAGVKVTCPGKMCMIMGTSGCHILMDEQMRIVPGFCGVAADGVMPGYWGLEAGQCCLGDHYAWVADNLTPASYAKEAQERGMSIHELLTEKMAKLAPGESGLLALDWWNGNRSVLVDAELSGLLLGMTLRTRAEEIYRALIEATAFGTRVIVESFQKAGVPVQEIVAAGGIGRKNPVLMQIFADIVGLPFRVGASKQTGALGSAIFAAAAASTEKGGYANVTDAAEHMGAVSDVVYTPNPEALSVYEKLYAEYVRLHDTFGRGENDVMKRLRKIAEEARGRRG